MVVGVSRDVKVGASALRADHCVDDSVRVTAVLELGGSTLEGLVGRVYEDEASLQRSVFRAQMLTWCLPPHFGHLALL